MTRTTDLSHAESRRGGTAALRRAAKAALRLAQETGTPCWVMVDGKIVDLNARPAPQTASQVVLHCAQSVIHDARAAPVAPSILPVACDRAPGRGRTSRARLMP